MCNSLKNFEHFGIRYQFRALLNSPLSSLLNQLGNSAHI